MCPNTRETLLPTSEEIDARFDYLLEHPEEKTSADQWMFREEYMDLDDIADDYDINDYDEEGDNDYEED